MYVLLIWMVNQDAIVFLITSLMGPPAMKPMSRQRKLAAAVPSFQIEAYERGRLKSFPPRAAPIPRVIQFNARIPRSYVRGGDSKDCPEEKNQVISKGIPDNIKTKSGHASIKLPEMSLKIDWTVTDSSHYRE